MKETVIQFGEGNFLRGFADYFLHQLNEKGLYSGKAVIVQPIQSGGAALLNRQNCVYNLYLRGLENGEARIEHTEIHSVSRAINPYTDYKDFLALAQNPDFRFVISNTTEAGIAFDPNCKVTDAPPASFPAKLTQLLHERFQAGLNGLVILACELIDNNAQQLKKYVLEYARLWALGDGFVHWINCKNAFCNTLVDRIVTGYPEAEAASLCTQIGYEDKFLNTAELYHLWVIEGDFEQELPLKKAGLNVIWTKDVSPYKKRKVRVLNGLHTAAVFPALLCGLETVGGALQDEQFKQYINACLFDNILPVLGNTADNRLFANAVLERFQNPYIKHMWKSIALNSVSKFTARVLPTINDYANANNGYPKVLVFSLACLIAYYQTNQVQDEKTTVAFIQSSDIHAILGSTALWGRDLSSLSGLVMESLEQIHSNGIREAVAWAMS